MIQNFKKIIALFSCIFYTITVYTQIDTTNLSNLFNMSIEELTKIKVITASKMTQSLDKVAATMFVVTSEQIKLRGYHNIEELLEDIPGVEIQKKSASEFNSVYTLRGIYGNEKFVILLDGFRINSPTGTPHATGANYSLHNAKRVEVILGPASALYGVDAFSGIINIISKDGSNINGGEIAGSYGNFNTTNNWFTYGQDFCNKNASFLISGDYYYTDEPFFPDYYPDDFSYYTDVYSKTGEMESFGSTVTLPIYPFEMPTKAYFLQGQLKFKNFSFGYSRNYESHNTSISNSPIFTIYRDDVVHAISVENFYGQNIFTSKNKKWEINTSLSRSVFTLEPESKWLNMYTNYLEGWEYGKSSSFKFEEQITYQINQKTNIIAGISIEDINALPKTNDMPEKFDVNKATDEQNIPYLGTEGLFDIKGNSLEIQQDFYYLNYQNYGSFLQFFYKPSEKFYLIAGGRYDYNTRYSSSFNPRVGFVLCPNNSLSVKALYGEAFLAPSPYKSYYHYGTYFPLTNDNGEVVDVMSGFMHMPNPDLQPEELKTFELNIQAHNKHFYITSSLFYTKVNDFIVRDAFYSDGYFKEKYIATIERPGNIGTQTIFGGFINFDITKAFGKIKTHAYISYNYCDGYFEKPDEPRRDTLSYAAKHTIKSGIDISHKKLSLSLRAIHRSPTYHKYLRYKNEAYTVFNFYVRYSDIFKSKTINTSAYIKIGNLFDKRYYNPVDGEPHSDENPGMIISPQDPLRIAGGIILKF